VIYRKKVTFLDNYKGLGHSFGVTGKGNDRNFSNEILNFLIPAGVNPFRFNTNLHLKTLKEISNANISKGLNFQGVP
jgi:hypothetical protein